MACGARTCAPFIFGLTAGTLLYMIFAGGNFVNDAIRTRRRCAANFERDSLRLVGFEADGASPPREYVYAAQNWSVERRGAQPPAASALVEDRAERAATKVIRARFAASELGIRERVLVVIFGESALSAALSTLLSPHVSRVHVFMEASRMDPEIGTSPNLTPYRANGQHAHVHVLNTIFNLTYHDSFNWFLFASERAYVNAFALRRLLDTLSWVTPRAVGRRVDGVKCHFEAGILLSNPALQMLIQERHLCSSIASSNDHEAFEMCVQHATNLTCNENEKISPYRWWHFEDSGESGTAIHERILTLRDSLLFNASITVSPLLSELDARALHAHFLSVEMARVDAQIDALAADLRENERELASRVTRNRSLLTAGENSVDSSVLSWPIGQPSAVPPPNRWQVPIWEYFTNRHLFKNWPDRNVERLSDEDALDVEEVVRKAREVFENKLAGDRRLQFHRLRNGYRNFNALRGMEYTVDLEYDDSTSSITNGESTKATLLKRVHLCRPIHASELIEAIPYVKEDTDIALVVPIESAEDVEATHRFLTRQGRLCETDRNTQDARQTRFVLATRDVGASTTHALIDKLVALRRRCKNWRIETALLTLKPPQTTAGVHSKTTVRVSLRVAAMDEAVDHYGAQAIYALLSPYVDYQHEFLDRIRISTIRRFQVFFPIPFVQFNPLIAKADEILKRNSVGPQFQVGIDAEMMSREKMKARVARNLRIIQQSAQNLSLDEWPIVVHKDHGLFDIHDFNIFSAYGMDYLLMRERYFEHKNRVEVKNKRKNAEKRETDVRGAENTAKISNGRVENSEATNRNRANVKAEEYTEEYGSGNDDDTIVDIADLLVYAPLAGVHALRAIEPAVRVRWNARLCGGLSSTSAALCRQSATASLGTKAQMANFTFRDI